jgi:hypothetical protein
VSQQSTEQQPQGGEGVQQQAAAPPWGSDEEFNPERAWKKIQALEADKERLKNRPTLDADAKRKLAEYDALVESQKTEAQKQAEETARWQSEAERWRTTSVASTIKALAATDFEYPDDAVGALDPAKYLGVDGSIDEKTIQTDLAALLEARPKWRRGEGNSPAARTPRPNTAQGASNGQSTSDPAQQFAAILQNRLAGA